MFARLDLASSRRQFLRVVHLPMMPAFPDDPSIPFQQRLTMGL
jgi:hypothetical protein